MEYLQGGAEIIPEAVKSQNFALRSIVISFGIGVVFYVVSLPFLRSKKSSWDVPATRKVLALTRIASGLEIHCIGVLLYL